MKESKRRKISAPYAKKVKISISLSASTVQIVDELRGSMTRSGVIDNLIQSHLSFMLKDSQTKKADGIFYTPEVIANYLARIAINYFCQQNKSKIEKEENYSVFDPACGEGELLNSFMNAASEKQKSWSVYGIDKDIVAAEKCHKRLGGSPNKVAGGIFIEANDSLSLAISGFNELLLGPKKEKRFDVVIANPPWGASLFNHGNTLEETFITARGQFDSADLFLEMGVSLLKHNGVLAYILPDSLFSLGKSTLRKFLLKNTKILLIGRLGEKFFPNVNRACCILVCQKCTPPISHKVKVYRLTPQDRSLILDGSIDLKTVEESSSHLIPQQRFISNNNYDFDIDLSENESSVVQKMRSFQTVVSDFFESHRGVELSKYGYVYQCPNCKIWIPLPHSKTKLCNNCNVEFNIDKRNAIQITSKYKKNSYKPIISGESILRYRNAGVFWIDITKNGINYKNQSSYRGDKIVVRKTGIGISATIDYSGAMTTQVVYSVKGKAQRNTFPLEVLLAIFNSRAFFYYITKLNGETEWRSHPYLTQSTIMNLPLPSLNKIQESDLNHIIEIIKKSVVSNNISYKDDIYIERLVANFFGLNKKDYEHIYRAISSVQELIPVRLLKTISIDDMFGE